MLLFNDLSLYNINPIYHKYAIHLWLKKCLPEYAKKCGCKWVVDMDTLFTLSLSPSHCLSIAFALSIFHLCHFFFQIKAKRQWRRAKNWINFLQNVKHTNRPIFNDTLLLFHMKKKWKYEKNHLKIYLIAIYKFTQGRVYVNVCMAGAKRKFNKFVQGL